MLRFLRSIYFHNNTIYSISQDRFHSISLRVSSTIFEESQELCIISTIYYHRYLNRSYRMIRSVVYRNYVV